MSRRKYAPRIRRRTPVVDVNGQNVGTVAGQEGSDLLVRKGLFFSREHRVPMSAVRWADDEYVTLSITDEELITDGGAENGEQGTDDA